MESYVPYWNESRQAELSISGKDAEATLCHFGAMNRIREFRERDGLTQEELAEKVGLKHSTISKLETGALELKARQIRAFASVFGVHPGEILAELPEAASSEDLPADILDRLDRLLGYSLGHAEEMQRMRAALKALRSLPQVREVLRLPPPGPPQPKE